VGTGERKDQQIPLRGNAWGKQPHFTHFQTVKGEDMEGEREKRVREEDHSDALFFAENNSGTQNNGRSI